MKKYTKLSTIILAAVTLFSSYGVFLHSSVDKQQDTQTSNWNNISQQEHQANRSFSEIEFLPSTNGPSNFAIVKDATNGDRVYGWGFNIDGQLGIGDSAEKVTLPTRVQGLPVDADISFIKSGFSFSLIVLKDNRIYAAGLNNYGQFGNGMTSIERVTIFTESSIKLDNITSIEVGSEHVAAISNGDLYTWGNNIDGRLGTGDTENKLVPTKIEGELLNKTLGKLQCALGNTYISTLTIDGKIDKLYSWGDREYLGFSATDNVKVPTASNFAFEGQIINFYASLYRLFVSTYDAGTDTYRMYFTGHGQFGSSGTGAPEKKITTFEQLPQIPDGTIKQFIMFGIYTAILTTSGDVFVCGRFDFNGIDADADVFTKIDSLSNISQLSGNAVDGTFFAVKGSELYGWGENTYGSLGIGSSDIEYKTPTLLDTFASTPSTFNQKKVGAGYQASTVASEIYKDGALVTKGYEEWIEQDLSTFPAGAIIEMSTAPVVDEIKGEIQLVFDVNKGFSQPDGAKAVDTKITMTLTGFKSVEDSVIKYVADEPWKTLYRYDNIGISLGEGINTNQEKLRELLDFSTFPQMAIDAGFQISGKTMVIDSTGKTGSYSAEITAKSYYESSIIVNREKKYSFTLSGLEVKPDSLPLNRDGDPWLRLFNADNIVASMGEEGSTNLENLNKTLNLDSFPEDTIFKIAAPNMKLDAEKKWVYTAELWAYSYYTNGYIINDTWKIFNISFGGFSSIPDSKITYITSQPWLKYNYEDILAKMGSGDSTNQTDLKTFLDLSSFPAGITLKIENPKLGIDTESKGTFSADLVPSSHYENGVVSTTYKQFPFVLDGFILKPNSNIIAKTNIENKIYNLNNINNRLQPNNVLNMDVFNVLFDKINFPDDAIFSITKHSVINGNFVVSIHADKAWSNGLIGMKDFVDITITGLEPREDSKAIKQDITENDLRRILENWKNGDVINKDIMNLLILVSEFPSDTTFTVNEIVINDSEPENVSFRVNKVYEAGETVIVDKDFAVVYDYRQVAPSESNNIGLMIGLVAGGVLLVVIIISLIVWFVKHKAHKNDELYD